MTTRTSSVSSHPEFSVSNLDAAKHAVVHDFPGGAVALAPLAGMNPGTLSNKVNPTIDSHHLTLSESVTIQAISQDYRILHAEAAMLGHAAIPLPKPGNCSDVELLNAYARWTKDIGETAAAINEALEGDIDEKALAAIHREMHEDFARALELFARFKQLGG
ncbi:phage regulatory CII family protein [Guyparkeria sp. GHLCS8-2]|uniref:phage regulatory CII family protein n=1 Tax=Guyparkeria halopsychrophila TaxID=3139421 RepID=UPI0037C5BE74